MSDGFTVQIDPRSLQQLAALNRELGQYAVLARKTMDETLDKKGRDLGIQMYREYTAHKLGKGIARRELDARAAAGKGTRVRPELLARYREGRAQFSKLGSNKGRKSGVNQWRRIVGAEVALRQSGAGVLGASFLMFRNRSNGALGNRQVLNRTGKPLGAVLRSHGTLSIIGYTPGLAVVDARYGIIGNAAAAVRADMAPYIARKLAEAQARNRFVKIAA